MSFISKIANVSIIGCKMAAVVVLLYKSTALRKVRTNAHQNVNSTDIPQNQVVKSFMGIRMSKRNM